MKKKYKTNSVNE